MQVDSVGFLHLGLSLYWCSAGVVGGCLVWSVLDIRGVLWVWVMDEEFFVVVFLGWFGSTVLVFGFFSRAWLVGICCWFCPHVDWALDGVVEKVLNSIWAINGSFFLMILASLRCLQPLFLTVRIKPVWSLNSLIGVSWHPWTIVKLLLHPCHHLPFRAIALQELLVPEIPLGMLLPLGLGKRARRVHQPTQ